jgi:alpha-amylase
MIMMEAAYRLWKNGQKQSVPAPWDADTPDVPVWYNHIASIAPQLAAVGYTHILLPPFCKTQSGRLPTGDGFGKFDDYDIGSKNQCGSVETRFGNRDQLLRGIAVCRANGLHVLGEAVLHQYDGGQKDGVYRYKGADGKTLNGRFPKDPPCFWSTNPNETIPPFVNVDPVWNTEGNFPFGNGVAVVNSQPQDYMAHSLIDACDWMIRTTGIDGLRVDDVKGMYAPFIYRFLTSKSMSDKWAFSEDFEGDPQQLHDWVWGPWSGMNGRSSVLDFTTHWHLQDVLDKGFPMSHINGAGYNFRDPFHAVTFVDSPDTDSAFDQQIVNSKLLAYAFILTCEGVPQIFYRDWAEDPSCYGLRQSIDNLVWIASKCAGGPTITRYLDSSCIVLNRTGGDGKPGLLTAINKDTWNKKTITCQTSFWPNTHLHDFTGRHPDIWCDGQSMVTFTVPSNAFGGGQSYLCFSWAGMEGSSIQINSRKTLQTFEAAADLDIPPAAPKATTPVQRIWVNAGTFIILTETTGISALAFSVTDASGVSLVTAPVAQPAPGRIGFRTIMTGWHAISVTNFNELTALPFRITVEYSAPAKEPITD